MKIRFHSPVDAKKLIRAGVAALMGFAVHSHMIAATPPVAIPYTITTVAGNGSAPSTTTGPSGIGGAATSATLSTDLRAVAVDGQGNLYIVDSTSPNVSTKANGLTPTNGRVWKVNAKTGIITTFAGGSMACTTATDEYGDGCLAATQTMLNAPRGVAVDKAGNVYIAGYSDELIHKVDAVTGIMTAIAGSVGSSKCTVAYYCYSGTKGYSGDGALATAATLYQPRGVQVDNYGNIWITDTSNNVIREVNATTGIITTAVGNDTNLTSGYGTSGYGGDGGLATSTSVLLTTPTDIVFDSSNNAYIADFGNHLIREVSASTGEINTIIGNSTLYSTGLPSAIAPTWPLVANGATLGNIAKLAIDSNGNLYFTDSSVNIVYFYDAAALTITPIAGQYDYPANSYSVCSGATNTVNGDGCPATQALINGTGSALGLAIDGLNNLYVTDPTEDLVRKVSTNLSFPAAATGASTTQTIELHSTVNDALTSSGISLGSSIANYAIASTPSCAENSDDTYNCTAQISYTPTYPGLQAAPLKVSTANAHRSFPLTGSGKAALMALDPGTASVVTSSLSSAQGEAVDAAGNLYIADTANNRVVNLTTSTVIASSLSAPTAVAVGPGGYLYIANTGSNDVLVYDPISQSTSTFAGGATSVCTEAYDAEGDNCPATAAKLNSPSGLAVDNYGNVYIADTGNNIIRRVDAGTGYINLEAGLVTSRYTTAGIFTSTNSSNTDCSGKSDSYGDGCQPTEASLKAPHGLAIDVSGDLYIADTGDSLVREIVFGSDTISTVAGNGQKTFSGDNSAATSAALNLPQGVTVDAGGNIYIADTGNHALRMVNYASQDITTLVGQGGTSGSTGGSGLVSSITMNSPAGIAVDAHGNLYISDTSNNRVIEDIRSTSDVFFGLYNNLDTLSAAQAITATNTGNTSLTFTDSPAYLLSNDLTSGNSDALDFVFGSDTCTNDGTLTAGENCTLSIEFDPQATASYAADVTLPSNAINSGAEINLSGTGKELASTSLALAITSPASGIIDYGESGTITATVTPLTGSGTPTGTIIFTIGGTQEPAISLSTTSGAQAAQWVLTLPPVGGLTVSASYSGDDTYAASSTNTSVSVGAAVTTTLLTPNPTTQTSAAPNITFTATVSSNTGALPTGKVYFCTGGVATCSSTSSTLVGTSGLTENTAGTAELATTTYTSTSGTSYSMTATYVDSADSNFTTSSSAVYPIAIAADFLPAISPATASVAQGDAVQISSVSVTTQGGISGTLNLSCTGLPANSVCTFFPTTLTLGGTSPVLTTKLTIYTNTTSLVQESKLNNSKQGSTPLVLSAAVIPTVFFAFIGWGSFRKRNWRKYMMALAAITLLGGACLFSGCANNATQQTPGVTPVGASTVEVVFTSANGVTHSVPITLTVVAGS